jgi:hypothetical protein
MTAPTNINTSNLESMFQHAAMEDLHLSMLFRLFAQSLLSYSIDVSGAEVLMAEFIANWQLEAGSNMPELMDAAILSLGKSNAEVPQELRDSITQLILDAHLTIGKAAMVALTRELQILSSSATRK